MLQRCRAVTQDVQHGVDDEPGTVRRTVEEGERARRSTRCTGISSVLPVVPSPAKSSLGYAGSVLERGAWAAARERG